MLIDYLHYEIHARLTKKNHKRLVMDGSREKGYMICQCSTEDFINYSIDPWETRAAFLASWMIGHNAEYCSKYSSFKYPYKDMLKKYKFVGVTNHGISGSCSAHVLAYVPRYRDKTFFNYDLINRFFKDALNDYLSENELHNSIYQKMKKTIERIEDDKCRKILLDSLNEALPDTADIYADGIPTFKWSSD